MQRPSMAKVLPVIPAARASSSSSPSPSPSSAEQCLHGGHQQRQTAYTVWMKSLVFNGYGCTVYGANGSVAYRVDNYGCKGGREVFFMDCAGRSIIRIQRKSFGMFRRWEACWCFDDDVDDGEGFGNGMDTTTTITRPWFRVQKKLQARRRKTAAAVVTMHDGSGRTYYVIDGGASNNKSSDYKICDADDGAVVAAVGRKQTPCGVVLGEDVLTLTVGSGTDHLLVLGVVVVCGLMNRRL